MDQFKILTINPGSTSTKVSIFEDTVEQEKTSIEHPAEEIKEFETIWEQLDYRQAEVEKFLAKHFPNDGNIDAVVGRGGLLRPIPGGIYEVNSTMLDDAKRGVQGQHASNLGCALAHRVATQFKARAFIVDPVSTNETQQIARISGNPNLERKSLSHALNIHYIARKVAEDINVPLQETYLVIAHLGGGFSIAAVRGGQIIDVNDANNEGPFSTARSGSLPTISLANWIIENEFTKSDIQRELLKKSGWAGYLNTTDGKEIERRLEEGDEKTGLILEAMAYQIAKEIGAMATVLEGRTERIILTGGLANFTQLINLVEHRIRWIAPVDILPGEFEMQAMAEGAVRALTGEQQVLKY